MICYYLTQRPCQIPGIMIKWHRKLEAIILGYIPKHRTCSIEESKRQYLREKEKITILEQIISMNPLELSITQEWEKQDPDMSTCKVCKEVIYGSQYQLTIMVNNEPVAQKDPVKLCEPCYLKKDAT